MGQFFASLEIDRSFQARILSKAISRLSDKAQLLSKLRNHKAQLLAEALSDSRISFDETSFRAIAQKDIILQKLIDYEGEEVGLFKNKPNTDTNPYYKVGVKVMAKGYVQKGRFYIDLRLEPLEED